MRRGRVQNLKPWPKGISGNPGGRPRPILSAALRRELEENPELARKIALAILAKAEKGDVRAFDAIADRLEGKPTQAVAIETADSQGDPGARLAELLERARQRMLETGSGGSGRRGRPA